jgi:hypothetical protein
MVATSKIDEVRKALLALIGFVLINTTSALVHDSKSDKRRLSSEFRLSFGKTAQTTGHNSTRTLVINDLAEVLFFVTPVFSPIENAVAVGFLQPVAYLPRDD